MLRALLLCPVVLCSAVAQAGPIEEKQVVLEMSEARRHPREYAKWLRAYVQYFEGTLWNLPGRVPIQTREGAAALEELLEALDHARPVGPLEWSEGLSKAARDFTLEQGPTGRIGHQGPTGSTLQSRALKHGLHQSLIGEVIAYGSEQPRWVVVQLLIDDGVSNRGHRNAILDPAFHEAGAAIGPHATYGAMTVVDLADRFLETPE